MIKHDHRSGLSFMNLRDKFFITAINLVSQIRPQIKDLILNTLTPHDGALFYYLLRKPSPVWLSFIYLYNDLTNLSEK